jgi:hypothetical protein
MPSIVFGIIKDEAQLWKKWSTNLSNLNRIIDQCSFILTHLDDNEEQRDLSIIEKKLQKIFLISRSKMS